MHVQHGGGGGPLHCTSSIRIITGVGGKLAVPLVHHGAKPCRLRSPACSKSQARAHTRVSVLRPPTHPPPFPAPRPPAAPRDVLNVLNMYPGDPGAPGSDCAGIVQSKGRQMGKCLHEPCGPGAQSARCVLLSAPAKPNDPASPPPKHHQSPIHDS